MKVNFEFELPYKIDLENVDISLKKIFTLDTELIKNSSEKLENLMLIDRMLLLGSFLQSFCGIPSFELGEITSYEEKVFDKNRRVAFFTISLPDLQFFLAEHRIKIYQLSLIIIEYLLIEEDKKLYDFLDEIYQHVILEFRRYYNQGVSTIPILEQAYREDIPFFNLSSTIYQLGWGSKRKLLRRSAIEDDSAIAAIVAENKLETNTILTNAGMPTTNSIYVNNEQSLIENADKLGWPVVIKPIDCERSEGVVTNITSKNELIEAYRHARKFSNNILMENHVQGNVYRIGLINNELYVVVLRLPKAVLGDGRKTIRKLIDDSNYNESIKAPWLRDTFFPKDNKAIICLNNQGLTLNTILEKGKYAYLRDIGSNQDGGVSKDFTSKIHPENVELIKRVSKLLNLSSIGVDIISTSIEKPWYENDAKIIEINFSPGIGGRTVVWGLKRIKDYLNQFFLDGSRIPISIYIGGENALKKALSYNLENGINKKNIFITNSESTYKLNGEKIILNSDNFYNRCRALLMNVELKHLIVVVQTNELLNNILPFDRINSLEVIDYEISDIKNNKKISKEKAKKIVMFFKNLLIK